MLNNEDVTDTEKLIILLEKVISFQIDAGYTEPFYKSLIRSINILKSKDAQGFHNIMKYINDDFRMMADRGLYGGEIDVVTNEIYSILRRNKLFYNK
ncbi:Uncharacterised protein [Cedecea lapagei]|uniref:Uncharacterized protein n=1 Tax=Cedecea lapagei TaxID=158823 RepID=A0A3S4JYW7_9ENTR|nr:hypothetical protein [Cedecea lapagei]VEB97011.1 Uncharacterised protein [Cedecea lapagei]